MAEVDYKKIEDEEALGMKILEMTEQNFERENEEEAENEESRLKQEEMQKELDEKFIEELSQEEYELDIYSFVPMIYQYFGTMFFTFLLHLFRFSIYLPLCILCLCRGNMKKILWTYVHHFLKFLVEKVGFYFSGIDIFYAPNAS